MKRVMAVMVVMAAVIACGVSYAGQETPTYPPPHSGLPTPTMRIGIIATVAVKKTTIVAPEGTRLRSRPDAAGPMISVELAVMLPGDEFVVESCDLIAGKRWAFGVFDTYLHGWTLAEYLSPNPCE